MHRFWGSNIWEVHRGPRRPVGLGVSERESGRGKVQRSGKEAGHEEPSRQEMWVIMRLEPVEAVWLNV